MINILYYIYGLDTGGAENFILNAILNIDDAKYHIDIVIQKKNITNKKLEMACKEKGIRIFFIPPFPKHCVGNACKLALLLGTNEYDIIHIHANSLINVIPIFVAKLTGTKVVLHAHSSTNNQGGIVGKVIHKVNFYITRGLIDAGISCSKEATEWMFHNMNPFVVPNAIDLNKFEYNEDKRNVTRRELNISNSCVLVGNVGRFVDAKNHEFLIDVFKRYHEINSNSKLLLIGEGPRKQDIVDKCFRLQLSSEVIFQNNVMDVSPYYDAMDVFLFPSLYEGLPFSLIEAQASGLKILASNTISKEVNICDSVEFLSLEDSDLCWANKINESLLNYEKRNLQRELIDSKFNICKAIVDLELIYDELISNENTGK